MRALAQYATCNMGEEGQEKGYPKMKMEDGESRERETEKDGEREKRTQTRKQKSTKRGAWLGRLVCVCALDSYTRRRRLKVFSQKPMFANRQSFKVQRQRALRNIRVILIRGSNKINHKKAPKPDANPLAILLKRVSKTPRAPIVDRAPSCSNRRS